MKKVEYLSFSLDQIFELAPLIDRAREEGA